MAGALCLPIAGRADTQTAHRVHKVKKQELPPPLPSGPQGPVPQIPLDAIPAVAPQVSYQDGLLTIIAPNSTLGDILRGVRKHTSADIEVPATASERVVTRLGPAPAREVMAELLNGSRFNYILLGSPEDANALVRVVSGGQDRTGHAGSRGRERTRARRKPRQPTPRRMPPMRTQARKIRPDDPDQGTAEAEQPAAAPAEQPGVKTPQQLLQEMQQRQLQMQQQQQPGQPGVFPGRPGAAIPPVQPQQQEQHQ